MPYQQNSRQMVLSGLRKARAACAHAEAGAIMAGDETLACDLNDFQRWLLNRLGEVLAERKPKAGTIVIPGQTSIDS